MSEVYLLGGRLDGLSERPILADVGENERMNGPDPDPEPALLWRRTTV